MNAKNVLLIFFCIISLSGKCGITDPPSGADEIHLVGQLDLNQGPNDIEAYADENYIYIYFHRDFGNVSITIYNTTNVMIYNDVANTAVQQQLVIPITGFVDGIYTVVLENATGYVDGDFEKTDD